MEMSSHTFDRVGTFFRNLRPKKDEEKIPFVHDSAKKSSGAILQVLPVPENSQIVKEAAIDTQKNGQKDSEKKPVVLKEDKGPMSKSRKACFLLSFNVWILYIAAFLWFIPCNFYPYPGVQKWSKTFSNMEFTTRLETVGESIIFGGQNTSTNNSHQTWGILTALDVDKGDVIWTKTLPFIPLEVHCRENASRKFPICTAIGEREVVLFDSINGDQLWKQTLVSDLDNRENLTVVLCGSSLIPIAVKRKLVIDRTTNQYKILNIDTPKKIVGLKFIDFPTDCDELLPKSDSIILDNSSESNMVLICTHPQSVDLWTVPGKFLCGKQGEGNGTVGEKLHHLYRISDPVPLPDDILITDVKKRGVVVGWSNVVVCVSKSTPSLKIWKHLFKNSSFVGSIIPGRFTSSTENQIAVTVQDESRSSVVHVINLLDGTIVVSMPVGDQKIRSISLIPGKKTPRTDRLLIEMETSNFTATPLSFKNWEMSKYMNLDESSTFYEINFEKESLTSRLVAEFSLQRKVMVNQDDEDDVDLVLLERKPDSKIVISNFVLRSSLEVGCS